MSGASELDAALSQPAARACLLWRVERADGLVLGFTDHDRPLEAGGVTYRPESGLEGAALSLSAELAPTGGSALGALSSAAISEEDLANGLWDGARVDVWRALWPDAEARRLIWSGRLGAVSRGPDRFEAALVSLKADLERRFGRLFTRTCDAELGDGRCGVDLSAPAHRREGAVVGVEAGGLVIDCLVPAAAGDFVGGRLVVRRAGALIGSGVISGHGMATPLSVALSAPLAGVAPGDTAVLTAGCDKRFETCRARFANAENFRGFPHLPGDDALIAGPAANGNDGGSRT